jgi:hypothetical protein
MASTGFREGPIFHLTTGGFLVFMKTVDRMNSYLLLYLRE